MKIVLKPQEKKQLLKDVLSGVIETRHYKRIFNEKGEVDVNFDFPTLQIEDFQEYRAFLPPTRVVFFYIGFFYCYQFVPKLNLCLVLF